MPRAWLPMSRTTRPPERILPRCAGRPRGASRLRSRMPSRPPCRASGQPYRPDLGRRDLQANPSPPFDIRVHAQGATHAARPLSHQGQSEMALARVAGVVQSEARAVVRDLQAQAIVLELQTDLDSAGAGMPLGVC